MVWYSHVLKNFLQLFIFFFCVCVCVCVIHTVKHFSIVSEEVDAFSEFSSFFYDPSNAGNLISTSSAFSKSSLNICKFFVHILLKPSLKDFEHYFVTCEMSELCGSLNILDITLVWE